MDRYRDFRLSHIRFEVVLGVSTQSPFNGLIFGYFFFPRLFSSLTYINDLS